MSEELTPEQLGRQIASLKGKAKITLIVGAGFSASAGIPTAAEIVRELKERDDCVQFTKDACEPPDGMSEYVHLMGKLAGPKQRAELVREWIKKADPNNTGRPNVNWAHLLLAKLMEENFINRVLTTNFDPLIVEALAMTGQPIRTYDLNSSGTYPADAFEPGTVIYLHGQMHSVLLANTNHELDRVAANYSAVLNEAIRDSFVILVGYSGECDKFVDSLAKFGNLPYKLYWSQFDEGQDCTAFSKIKEAHQDQACIMKGLGADEFMLQLVTGLELKFPVIVQRPQLYALQMLERIVGFPEYAKPEGGPPRRNPLPERIEQLRRASDEWDKPTDETELGENLLAEIETSILFKNWEEFQVLKSTSSPDPTNSISRAIGDGLVILAGSHAKLGDPQTALDTLAESRAYGYEFLGEYWRWMIEGDIIYLALEESESVVPDDRFTWYGAGRAYENAHQIDVKSHAPLNKWGITLARQAEFSNDLEEKVRLLKLASEKYKNALRIKPDFHEALTNWGTVLTEQAKLSNDPAEKTRLLSKAATKYEKALRFRPDYYMGVRGLARTRLEQAMLADNPITGAKLLTLAVKGFDESVLLNPSDDEALYNAGVCLSALASLCEDPSEKAQTFARAITKYEEVTRIKLDDHAAWANWGSALLEVAKLASDPDGRSRLFILAFEKYEEAVRIKPDYHDAFYNWGNGLSDLAKLTSDLVEQTRLFSLAFEKYEKAIQIMPEDQETYFNLGCLHALQGQVSKSLSALTSWAQFDSQASQAKLDNDEDFDLIREDPDFQAFRATLPPE